MARKIDPSKELKNPDQFVSFWTKVGKFLNDNQKAVVGFSLGLVVAIAVGWGAKSFLASRNAKASEAFARIDGVATSPLIVENEKTPPPGSDDFPRFKTEKERLEAAVKEADAFLGAHGGSGLKEEALLLKARYLLRLDRAGEALPIYQQLVGGALDERLRFLAQEGLAYAQEASGQIDHAIASFGKLADDAQNAGGFYRDRALYQKARLLQGKGNAAEAEKLLKEILEKSPSSSLREEINDRLAAIAKK